jgi:protein SCO1/2
MDPRTKASVCLAVLMVGLAMGLPAAGQDTARHTVTGMVIEVQPSRQRFVVSHDSIPGEMSAMTMAFEVQDPKELDGVTPGTRVTFTLVMDAAAVHAEHVRILRHRNTEQDPLTAERLRVLTGILERGAKRDAIAIGRAVPDFTLIDQARRPLTLSQFRGRVVAINFIYTSCALPQFCFRLANQFGVLQRRFRSELDQDLILLTVTFDPARDNPEVLADYARRTLKAETEAWHVLTGENDDVRRVCELFGVDFFQDEGLMNHSSHTVVINRQGTLVANIEGNELTSRELGDLVATVLRR